MKKHLLLILISYLFVSIFNTQAVNFVTETSSVGSLQCNLTPATAVTNGAQWNVDGGPWQVSGAIVSNLTIGSHVVNFKEADDSVNGGFNTPTSQNVSITNIVTTKTISGVYTQPRTIQFSGMTWKMFNVVPPSLPQNAGNNYWSNSSSSVWVDTSGRLHLKIRYVAGNWYCAEVYALQSLGYGEYRFNVSSNLEAYDPNIVVGLFTYESDNQEIDMEFSYWSNEKTYAGLYTVQPSSPAWIQGYDQLNFPLKYLNSDYKSTHKFTWTKDGINFQSYHGFSPTLPATSGSLIRSLSYSGFKNPPSEQKEYLKINLWLYKGRVPTNLQNLEVIIDSVSFTPTKTASVDAISASDNNLSISPNPATDYININSSLEGPIHYTIYNFNGTAVASAILDSSTMRINITSLKSGFYIVKLNNHSIKFMKL